MLSSDEVWVPFAAINSHGVIQRVGSTSLAMLTAQAGDGEFAMILPEGISDTTHYWDGQTFVAYPPKPGEFHVWEYGLWVDRSPVPPDPAEEMWQHRQIAALNRLSFGLALERSQILPVEDVEAIYNKQIPASLMPIFDALPESWQHEAKRRFQYFDEISRMDPILLIFAAEVIPDPALRDDLMDMAFGIIPWSADYPPI